MTVTNLDNPHRLILSNQDREDMINLLKNTISALEEGEEITSCAVVMINKGTNETLTDWFRGPGSTIAEVSGAVGLLQYEIIEFWKNI
jgi:hypothetical protein